MLRLTPAEFRERLVKFAGDQPSAMEQATNRAALHVKRSMLFAATSRVKRTPKPKGWWVQYVVSGNPTGATAKVYPYGGYAILAEKGSYKKPGGYQIPRPSRRRRKGTGWRGPFLHPAIKAQPWWQDGWDRARPGVARVYYEAENDAVARRFGR